MEVVHDGAVMTQVFDPYHKWLGIPPAEQPANHYRLLGLTLFEGDADAIESAADQRMAHVRTFSLGQHAETSQRLLNELAAARVCLLKPSEKSGYDRKLRDSLAMTAREDDDARDPERRSADVGAMNVAPSGQRAPQAGSPQAVSVIVAPRVIPAVPPVLLPLASAAPMTAARAPVRRESVATALWLANERNKIAFYRLLGRSLWFLLGAIPLCFTGYVAVNRYRVNQPAGGIVRDDRHEFAEPAPNALPPKVHAPVAMTDGGSPSDLSPTKAASQSTAPAGKIDFNSIAARQRPRPESPQATLSAPARFPPRIYPLDRVWFVGWGNSRWTDIRDRFEALQSDDGVAIKCEGENGESIRLRRMIFHDEDPAKTKMVVRFLVERGSISFGFQSRDLSTVGETVTQELTAGQACIAESWLDAAARRGVTRFVGAPQSGVAAVAVPLDSYFAITVSGDSLLRVYELRFEQQSKGALPIAATKSPPPPLIPAPPATPTAIDDIRESESPDDKPQADTQPVAELDARLKGIQASIERRRADIERLKVERGKVDSEIQSMEQKLPSLNKALSSTRSSKSAERAMIALQQAKNAIKKARMRLRRFDDQIGANERHIEAARARLEELRPATREAAPVLNAD